MGVTLVLGISILLQFAAAFSALRLIRVTGKRTAWALIATAVFLMAVRRCITLFRLLTGDLSRPPDLPAELVALAISVLMAVGIARIAPVFLSIRRSEDTLRESEERLYLLVQNMPVMMDAFDADWNIIVWNRECERVTGYSADEIIGNPQAMELLYPDAAYRERMMAEWIERGDDYRDWEWEITCKDGSVKTVAWSNISKLFPIPGWATWGIGMDVTERKRVEEALKLRMEQLAALSRASQAVTASLELDQVLAEIVSLAGEVLASDYTSVVLVDEAGHIGRSAENLSGVPTIKYRVRDEGLTNWIVHSRQAVVIDEIGEDGTINPDLGAGAPRTANPLIVEAGVKSVAGLPLVAKDRLLGVLYLHSLRPAAFRGQLPLLTTFANQVAFAIENARLYEEAKGHAAKLATLYETGKDITLILELDALLQLIAERSARLTGADKSLILLVDTEAQRLTKAVGFGFTPGQIESITYQEVQDGISGWVLRERTPTISEDILTDPRSTGLALQMAEKEHEKGKSIAVAPLLIKGKVIGTLTVINNVGKPTFSQDDLDLVVMLASQAAIAIENARLYEAVQQELAERKRAEEALRRERDLARALEAAAAVVSSTLDPDQVLDRILEQVGRVVPNDASNIMLIEGDQARIVRWRGYERLGAEEFVSTIVFHVPKVRHLQQMIESKEPIIIPDTATYPSWVHVSAQRWLRSYAAAPIVVRDEVIGFLNVDSATPGFFTQAHAESLRAFASHAAAAIENARLYESERKRSAELKTLHLASLHLTSTLELRAILEAILTHAFKVVAADDAHIFLYDGERLSFGAALWADGRQQEPYAEPRPQGLTYTVARSGERIVVSDVNNHPLFQDWTWGGAIVGLPLCIRERVVGVMNVAFNRPRAFDEDELRVLGLLADQAAIAIENARLYEEAQKELAERKQVEAALRQSEERYRSIVENSHSGILIVDDAYRFIYVNDELCRILGYPSEEIIGQDFRKFLDDESRQLVADRYLRRQRGEVVPPRYEFNVVRKDGEKRRVEISTTVIKDSAGKVQTVAQILDITERKRLEEQLLQAQKMEAVGRLAGGVAHDFNNLLTAITGYTELLLMRIHEHDPLRKDLEQIRRAADRAASLTRQLLAFSRKQMLRPRMLNLNAVVADMKEMLQRLIGEDIDLVTVLQPELGRVKADPGQIEQVIMNLIVNARDAMPQGGKLTIETANVVLDEDYVRRHVGVEIGSYVMLAVSDTGVGMDEEIQSHLFEPFFTTKETGKGTGLGLATTYGIVKQSNGHIWVYSEPGQGTTFKIYLPRVEEAIEPVTPVLALTESLRGTEIILLVEDEDAVREPARRILVQNGYTVLEARHGEEALRVCEQHEGTIHLMVTDVVMPEMSGRELAERLALLQPEMKVLYMSGYTYNAIASHGVLEPGIDFLQKPFTPDALVCKVREVLDAP